MEQINHSQDLIAAKQLTTPERIILWGGDVKHIEFVGDHEDPQDVWRHIRSLQITGWCIAQSTCGAEVHAIREGSGIMGTA